MHIRVDSRLHKLLRELHEQADDDTAAHIFDAMELMGAHSPYKGGRKLLEMLHFVEREAKSSGDEFTAEGIRDAISYADGRLLDDDLEEKYNLYNNSGQDRTRGLQNLASAAGMLTAQEISKFLEEHPEASGQDVRSYFETVGRRAVRFVRSRRAGHYGAFRIGTDIMAWPTDVFVDRVEFLPARDDDESQRRAEQLLTQEDGDELVAAALIKMRLAQLDRVERVATAPFSKERDLQRELESAPWIFGGAYVAAGDVRRLSPGNEVDIALVRPDGVLHVVELKRANLHTVKTHRSAPIPTADVHDAVMQVSNYLRDFDEQRSRILEKYGIDARRAAGTVVIGHPKFDRLFTEQEVNEALRTYTSHLSRVDVVTYKQLIDSARRALLPLPSSPAWGS